MYNLNRKIKVRNIIILALICTGLGFFIAYLFFIAPLNNSKSQEVLNPNNISKKLIAEDVIVSKLQEKQELITLEADLSQSMTIDDSWGTLDIFKKVLKINYVGKGIYVIPLTDIKADSINITNKSISIKIPEPSVKSITIDEDKTTFETTQKGFLRFGDIKLTPSENQEMVKTVKEKMLLKMKSLEMYDKAKESSEKAFKELIKTILGDKTYNQYDVKVEY